MRFQAPQLGALGVTFTALRGAQFIAFVTIVGLVANFINEIVTAQHEAPDVLVGTLVVASIGCLYVAITYILYYDGMLPLLIVAGCDMALLIAAIVVSVTVGRPLSMLTCENLPKSTANPLEFVASATSYAASSSSNTLASRSVISRAVNYMAYVAVDQPHCYEIKAVWGLSIALCVLFAFSGLVCAGLWRRVKSLGPAPGKDIETASH